MIQRDLDFGGSLILREHPRLVLCKGASFKNECVQHRYGHSDAEPGSVLSHRQWDASLS